MYLAVVLVAVWLWFRRVRPRSDPSERLKEDAPVNLSSGGVLTTRTAAAKAFAEALEGAGYGKRDKTLLRETVADFREQLRCHVDELRDTIAAYREERTKEREFLRDVFDDEDVADKTRDDEPDRELVERRRRLAELEAGLAALIAEQKAMKADLLPLVTGHVRATLYGGPEVLIRQREGPY